MKICSFLDTGWTRRPTPQCRFILVALVIAVGIAIPTEATFEVPGDHSDQEVVLLGGVIHPVSGPEIENGYVMIRDGKVVAVGATADLDLPANAQTMDVAGRHVYPGLIDADTAIGLVEIEAVRATVDSRETGLFNSNVHAQTAFNPDSELIPVARSSGVLLALSVPRGQFVTGLSSLMELDGWQSDGMALRSVAGLHVIWPTASMPASDADPDTRSRIRNREQQLRDLTDTLRDARGHQRLAKNSHHASNLRLEAFTRVVDREIPLMVHADGAREIQEAVAFAKRENLRLVIVGGYDAPQCAELLKANDVPVIVTGTHRLPRRSHSPVHEPFTVPARLQVAGVQFCISGHDRFSAANIRNLTHHVGTAIAHGLAEDDAVRAMTLSAAEILDVADRVGSIEPGKDATLIVTTGNVFDAATQVELALIQGRPVDLDNRQKRLWRKYQVKYQRLAKNGSADRNETTVVDVDHGIPSAGRPDAPAAPREPKTVTQPSE